jgi:HAD superfamily hydrolase (TIGR01509 family)
MVQAIIFDCFGVLTTDKWREFTATLPPEQRDQARELNRAYGGAFIDKTEFLQAIYTLTGKLPEDIEETLDHNMLKNKQLLRLIAELRPAYKIGLLSNVASNWIRDQFLTADEQKLFDDFVFSYEQKMTKPDARLFELAAQRLGVPVTDCVLVDDVERYCSAAGDLGMQAVLYRNFPQARADLMQLLA